MRVHRLIVALFRCLPALLSGGVLAVVLLGWGVLYLIVPRLSSKLPGGHASLDVMSICRGVDPVSCTTPQGKTYRIFNSPAVFNLDMAAPDRFSQRLFPNFAAAGAYARANGLAVLPSAQMLLTKCRYADQRILSTLELAIQQGALSKSVPGRQDALRRVGAKLTEIYIADKTGRRGQAAQDALVHVAAALDLGGAVPLATLPAELRADIAEATAQFLGDPLISRPLAAYAEPGQDELAALFRQDRFLFTGLPLARAPDACILLCAVIGASPELTKAFQFYDEAARLLTNPRLANSLSPAQVLSHFGAARLDVGLTSDDAFSLLCSEFRTFAAGVPTVFPRGEPSLALIAYAECKENDILTRFVAGSTMDMVAEAVMEGRLSLTPRPVSGWYDHQWYALETLLLPTKAQEACKLIFNRRYTMHLRESFKVGLSSARETHIRALPLMTLGGLGDDLPKVTVKPAFLVEPTATVYLRMARCYRVLGDSLRALVGPQVWAELQADGGKDSVATALDELTRARRQFYGIYDRLCLELGLPTAYDPDEMSPAELPLARQAATQLFAQLWQDPDLSRDCRMVLPVLRDADGVTHCWSLAGVKLMPTTYAYREKPRVEGAEPVCEAAHPYLPVAVFAEFATRNPVPATRAEFQATCNGFSHEAALRRGLGSTPGGDAEASLPWWLAAGVAVALLALAGLVWARCHGLCTAQLTRRMRQVAAWAAVLLFLAAVLVAAMPAWRFHFLIKYVAVQHPALSMICWRWVEPEIEKTPATLASACVRLLADNDPQVRHTVLWMMLNSSSNEQTPLQGIPAVRKSLLRTLQDPVPEIRVYAARLIDPAAGAEYADALLLALQDPFMRPTAAYGLGRVGEPRALPLFLEATAPPKRFDSDAWYGLSNYADPLALRRLLEMVVDESRWPPPFYPKFARTAPTQALTSWLDSYKRTSGGAGFPGRQHECDTCALDTILCEYLPDPRIPLYLRLHMLRALRDGSRRAAATEKLLSSAPELRDVVVGLRQSSPEQMPALVRLAKQMGRSVCRAGDRADADLSGWREFSSVGTPATITVTAVDETGIPEDRAGALDWLAKLGRQSSAKSIGTVPLVHLLKLAQHDVPEVSKQAQVLLSSLVAASDDGCAGDFSRMFGSQASWGPDTDAIFAGAVSVRALPLPLRCAMASVIARDTIMLTACRTLAHEAPLLVPMARGYGVMDSRARQETVALLEHLWPAPGIPLAPAPNPASAGPAAP